MKKTLLLLFSLFFVNSPAVLADGDDYFAEGGMPLSTQSTD